MAVGAVATRESVSTRSVKDVSATSNPLGRTNNEEKSIHISPSFQKDFSAFRTDFLLHLFHQANSLQGVDRGILLSSSCTKIGGDPIFLVIGTIFDHRVRNSSTIVANYHQPLKSSLAMY